MKLPQPSVPSMDITDAFTSRKSQRNFSKKPLELLEVSNLLFYSCGLTDTARGARHSRRVQPSGGALYPVEAYLAVHYGNRELPEGIYHYNVLDHCLEKLPQKENISYGLLSSYPWVEDASCLLIFSFISDRNMPKYGTLSYKLALIEAGHISQNAYLVSVAMGLGCCALGTINAELIQAHADLDGISEVVFHSLAIGGLTKV